MTAPQGQQRGRSDVTRTHRYARLASAVLAGMHALIAVAYTVWPPATPRFGQVSVALYIAQFGPVWTIGHGLVAAALTVALFRHRPGWLVGGHVAGATVVAGYGAALLATAILSPLPAILPLALMVIGLAATHWLGALMWRVADLVHGSLAAGAKESGGDQ